METKPRVMFLFNIRLVQ